MAVPLLESGVGQLATHRGSVRLIQRWRRDVGVSALLVAPESDGSSMVVATMVAIDQGRTPSRHRHDEPGNGMALDGRSVAEIVVAVVGAILRPHWRFEAVDITHEVAPMVSGLGLLREYPVCGVHLAWPLSFKGRPSRSANRACRVVPPLLIRLRRCA